MITLVLAIIALVCAIVSFVDSRLPWLGIAVVLLALIHIIAAAT